MIDQYPPANGVLTSLIWRKTAAGGETSLSGYDNASQALSYTPGQEQVYLNGILLVRGDDYTATNGTSITGLAALSASDFVQINCYNNFSVASLPTSGLVGEISNSQITSLATSKLTGTVTNAQLAGSISNDKLSNSSITINGSAVALGGSATIAGGSAQDDAPASPTEGQLWLDTNGTLATTAFTEKSTLTTTGDIYYASAANTPARIGIGSSGQVLTVASGIPSWATASSGSMTLLQNVSLSGASSITSDTLSGAYNDLVIYIINYRASANNQFLKLRFNGDTSTGYAQYSTRFSSSGTNYGPSGSITETSLDVMDGNNQGMSSAEENNIIVTRIFNYANTIGTGGHKLTHSVSKHNKSGIFGLAQVLSSWQNTNAIMTITFFNNNSTNFSSGNAYIYGVK